MSMTSVSKPADFKISRNWFPFGYLRHIEGTAERNAHEMIFWVPTTPKKVVIDDIK